MKPIKASERYDFLDVLRGFALIGVLIANMASHSGYFWLTESQQAEQAYYHSSEILMWWIHFLTDGKFYSIFSLLFGIGFALQLERAMEREQPFAGHFRRRLGYLFLIGLIHAVFFYVGDILMLYAMVGLFLLLFRRVSNRGLIWWTVILLILPIVQYLVMWSTSTPSTNQGGPAPPEMTAQIIDSFKSGTITDIIFTNIFGIIGGRYPDIIFTGRVFRVLAMFVLGYYVAREKLYLVNPKNIDIAKKVLVIGFIIGIPCNWVLANMMETDSYYSFGEYGYIQPMVYAFGVPALGLAYASALFLLFQKTLLRSILMLLSPFGRMALTNYITQSIIATFIYFNYGLALYLEHSPVQFTLLALGILTFQIAFSYFWLKKFRFGPLEWLWRSLTYGRRQSFLK